MRAKPAPLFSGFSKLFRDLLIIIGEAANQIPEEIEETYTTIPWTLMRAMQNRIVHVYFKVDEKLMWDTIRNDLPPLVPELEKLI